MNKLNAELVKVVDMPEIANKFKDEGAETIRSTPDQFRQFIATEVQRWRKVVHDSGIKAE